MADYRYGHPDSLFSRLSLNTGKTVYRKGGVWYSTESPSQNDLALADRVATVDLPGGEEGRYLFLGGHMYGVSQAVADLLTAAGFTVSEVPFAGFGAGAYGEGAYGS